MYQIQPEKPFAAPFWVQCDQQYEGGGWTVIQNRFDGRVNFLRPWSEYKAGFGNLQTEFWLGLDRIHQLTYSAPHELHILMEDSDGKEMVAKYAEFAIASEFELYNLIKLGAYSGEVEDALSYHRGMNFSTIDKDNDSSSGRCAVKYSGAWWYKKCHTSNLNGPYIKNSTESCPKGMCWSSETGQRFRMLKKSKMLIRSLVDGHTHKQTNYNYQENRLF